MKSEEYEQLNYTKGYKPPFVVDPQTPEIPWDEYLEKLDSKFKFWKEVTNPDDTSGPPPMPNLPEKYQCISSEILPDINFVELNKRFREILETNSIGTFYRPGLGYGGALEEILGKMGTYCTIVITDPVYAENSMPESYGTEVLPIDYYIRVLSMIDATQIEVTLSDDYTKTGQNISPEEYITTQIPEDGKATISFKVNGVDLKIHLLTEDMTKFSPSEFKILTVGRPTPIDQTKTNNPFTDRLFPLLALTRLQVGGVLESNDLRVLPQYLPTQVFGMEILYNDGYSIFSKKTKDLGEILQIAYKTEYDIGEALGALSGKYPHQSGYMGYYKEINENFTLNDVVDAYSTRLESIFKFVQTLPIDLRQATLNRLEELFISPIATDRKLDIEKLTKLKDISSNPDTPTKYAGDGYYDNTPYFGSPRNLIDDHNKGKIDALRYYETLISRFYERFPQSEEK